MINFFWYRDTEETKNALAWMILSDDRAAVWVFIESRYQTRMPFPILNLKGDELDGFFEDNQWVKIEELPEFLSEHRALFDHTEVAYLEKEFI